MALTRRMLNAMGIEAEKIDEIIAAHTETVDALKEQRDTYKADAEKLTAVQKELDDFKADAEKNGGKAWQTKYEAMKDEKEKVEKDFNDFKAEAEAEKSKAAKDKAYRNLLKEIGISDKRIDSVMKVTDLSGIELDDKGSVKDADKMKDSAKQEWADFIVTKSEEGARTSNPPAGNNGGGVRAGRAAQIAAKYHESLYGKSDTKGDS